MVGKARVSRNALRHGLSVSILNDRGKCAEVEALARVIAGLNAGGDRLDQAHIIAEVELDPDASARGTDYIDERQIGWCCACGRTQKPSEHVLKLVQK